MGNDSRQSFPLRSGACAVIAFLICLFLIYATTRFSLAASVSLWLKYTYLTAPLMIAGIYVTISRYEDYIHAGGVVPAFMLCVCLIVLVGMWQAGVSDTQIIGGLFPYSDAHGYYTDALRLLHGERFSVFSSRRPLFPAFLATILSLTDLNLRVALILLTGMVVIAICFAVREVRRSLGLTAATVMLVCLFMFYRRYIGSTLTEHLGLTFGCLAFALIWHGAVVTRSGPVFFGLFLLSLALNARAGTFLILPAILLWAAWLFRGSKGSVLRTLGGGTAAVLLGFGVNSLVLHAVGIPGAAYSNFSYVLYGLVFGGNWSLALQQHPELATLAPVEQAHRVYTLAWEHIRTNPLSLLTGSIGAWRAFFLGRSGTWFSFILYLSPDWADLREMLLADGVKALNFRRDLWVLLDVSARELWIICLHGLLAAGLIVLWRNHRRPLPLLIIAAWTGILLSVPFVPPWDADNMRAYAATIPFVIALPMMGLSYRREGATQWVAGEQRRASPRVTDLWIFSVLLIALQILGPLAGTAGATSRLANGQEKLCAVKCAPTCQARLVSIDPRTSINLVDSMVDRTTDRPGNYVNVRDLRERRHIKDYPDVWHIWHAISRLPAGTTLAMAYDVRSGDTVYVQSRSTVFPPSQGLVLLCGEVIQDNWIEWFRADSMGAC
ncbi:MAG: hypothetical protein ACHQ7N_07320 [Candidatus Methylomirabilales bacterium]